MGINDEEWRTLGSIEARLAGSDPTLASMLAIFSRLTSGEEMPAREKIGAPRRSRPRFAAALLPAKLSLWLIVSAGLIATALVLSASGHGACTQFIGTVCGG